MKLFSWEEVKPTQNNKQTGINEKNRIELKLSNRKTREKQTREINKIKIIFLISSRPFSIIQMFVISIILKPDNYK
ncbi:hypothetical protein D924_02600 [Enterococcus faecalis 06-MB-S-10]|nr:hypothetical protein D924_02600 [Enterococcus faecalis 06-MB-S-10]EPH85874.1 hypothetical protein D923_02994 [Enterococcus faecalis 06-MB-S-04]EPH88492.1 hypothetical protein D921_02897 [Enterococcus faecalis F01966]EPI29545.1 hypothetical protein D349_02078 [Enterococcus faecalis UP2S-6]TBH15228.1 hypothetical protein EYC52_12345 [Enterococcus faecalis]